MEDQKKGCGGDSSGGGTSTTEPDGNGTTSPTPPPPPRPRPRLLLGDAEILKKCLEENKGDKTKCQSQIDAMFESAKSAPAPVKPLIPLHLRTAGLAALL
ncbi:hypothetical protein Dimus_006540 [Dionaea muscipula]